MSDSVHRSGQAGTFFRTGNRCYIPANPGGRDNVKRVNLLEYFELAQAVGAAKRLFSTSASTKAGNIYFGASVLVRPMTTFQTLNDGFTATKHVAHSLVNAIERFNAENIHNAQGVFEFEKLDVDISPWQWSSLTRELDAFIAVFTAECRDLEMYSVGQIGIYNMNSLVSKGSERFDPEHKQHMPPEAMAEFDNAGRCLAFNLPTACGFHSIRGLELCLLAYIGKRSAKAEKMKSWNDYHNEIEKLGKELSKPQKPSAKIAPMIQRMKELDRNPLMHPRDNLDISGADQLFNLAAITAVELAKDDIALAAAKAALPAPANEGGEQEQGATAAA
jgi:hypothetical protein